MIFMINRVVPHHIKAISPEEKAILDVAKKFLHAVRQKSRTDFERCCFPAGAMSLCGPALSPLRFVSINSYINSITALAYDLDEQISEDAEVRISMDGNLAMVWAPFQARVDGRLHHVGEELFILHKLEGKWKISGLADSWCWPTDEAID